MTEHTPGPWVASHRRGADGNYRTEVYSAEHGGIATCDWTMKHCGNGVTETYRAANAALIAAAPDLFAALRTLLTYPSGQYSEGGDFDAAWSAAKAAVARVVGAA